MASDEQLIHRDPAAVRHADDTVAFLEAHDPITLPEQAEVKWIEHPDQHEDRPGQLLATRNHDVIAQWAQMRNAKPARLKAANPANPEQALRFQVSERRESEYELITWPDWFSMMDEADLVFLFHERNPHGEASDVFKLVPSSAIRSGRR